MSGSVAFAAFSALAALSFTGIQLLKESRSNKAIIAQAQNQNASIANAVHAMNTASVIKSLLTGSASPDHVPALFARHYYDDDWSLTNNSDVMIAKSTKLSGDGQSIELATGPSANIKEDDLAKIMNGKSVLGLKGATNRATVLGLKRNSDVGKEFWVEAIDLRIDSTVSLDGVQKTYSQALRVPLPEPLPYDIKLEIRPASGGPWVNANSIATLQPGLYEGRVKVSGVAMNAIVERNGETIAAKSGFLANGKLSHAADNMKAKDVVIIDPFPIDLNNKVNPEECKFLPADDSFEFVTKISGPSGTFVSSVKTIANAENNDPVPRDELVQIYLTRCLAQCPFAGHPDNFQYGFEEPFWKGEQTAHGKRYYGSLAGSPMIHVGVTDGILGGRKLCVNYKKSADAFEYATGAPLNSRWDLDQVEGGKFGGLAEYYIYDPDTCAEKKLFDRTKCGCFAEKTLITLGDGKSQKMIKDIRYSDRVWNPLLKKAYPIRKITRGPEAVPMISITASGKELTVTGKHPFPTRSGIKVAHNLEEGEEIQLGDGTWTAISSIESVPPGNRLPVVWNIEVDASNQDLSAHHLLANGVVTGDLYIQTRLESVESRTLKASND